METLNYEELPIVIEVFGGFLGYRLPDGRTIDGPQPAHDRLQAVIDKQNAMLDSWFGDVTVVAPASDFAPEDTSIVDTAASVAPTLASELVEHGLGSGPSDADFQVFREPAQAGDAKVYRLGEAADVAATIHGISDEDLSLGTFCPRRDVRRDGPFAIIHRIDVARGYAAHDVVVAVVNGMHVDYGTATVRSPPDAARIFVDIMPCYECFKKRAPCRCKAAVNCIRTDSCIAHQTSWDRLPEWLRYRIARSDPPALFAKDAPPAVAGKYFELEEVWQRAFRDSAVRKANRKLLRSFGAARERLPEQARTPIDRKVSYASQECNPPLGPLARDISLVQRDEFHEPLYAVFYPDAPDVMRPGPEWSTHQAESIIDSMDRLMDHRAFERRSTNAYNAIMRLRYPGNSGLAGQAGLQCNAVRKMPAETVWNVRGRVLETPHKIDALATESLGNYPIIVLGLASFAKRDGIPVWTWDGVVWRQRYASVTMTEEDDIATLNESIVAYLRFDGCLSCDSYPRDKGAAAHVRMCSCPDLVCMPHFGAAGCGGAVKYAISVNGMLSLPRSLQARLVAHREPVETISYEAWRERMSLTRPLSYQVTGGLAMAVPIDPNFVLLLDTELADYWLQRRRQALKEGDAGWVRSAIPSACPAVVLNRGSERYVLDHGVTRIAHIYGDFTLDL